MRVKVIKRYVIVCSCILLFPLLSACQTRETSISLPKDEQIVSLESAVGYDLDTVLDTLGLTKKSLTELAVPGYWATGRSADLSDKGFEERVLINHDSEGTESYGFSQYSFVYQSDESIDSFSATAEAVLSELDNLYGPAEYQPLVEEDWIQFLEGESVPIKAMWQLANYTYLSFDVLPSDGASTISLIYSGPELYQTRMVNQGYLDREDALFYLEGVE